MGLLSALGKRGLQQLRANRLFGTTLPAAGSDFASPLTQEQSRLLDRLLEQGRYTVQDVPYFSIQRQHDVEDDFLEAAARYASPREFDMHLPTVARANGKLWLMNGHHRLAAITDDTARVRLIDLDGSG